MENVIFESFTAHAKAVTGAQHIALRTSLKAFSFAAIAAATLPFVTSSAFSACDASISTNAEYTSANDDIGTVCVDSTETIAGAGVSHAIKFNGVSGISLENSGILGPTGSHTVLAEGSTFGSIVNGAGGLITSTNEVALLVQSNSKVLNGVTNSGSILSTSGRGILFVDSEIEAGGVINIGTVTARDRAIDFDRSTIDGGILNSGDVTSENTSAIEVSGSTLKGGITNTAEGSISGRERGIHIDDESNGIFGTVDFIVNKGLISSSEGQGIRLERLGNSVRDITNVGNITGAQIDIENNGSISALNNYQGSTGSGGSALTYRGRLPTNYNMIAYGDQYGQLAVNDDDDSTDLTFGIFSGDLENGIAPTRLKRQTYLDVMTGVEVGDIQNTWAQTTLGDHRSFGTYNGMLWMLRQRGYENPSLDKNWNLEVLDIARDFFGATMSAVGQRMTDLQGKIDTGAGSGYDCDIAGGKSGCVGLKGVYRDLGGGETGTAGALFGAFRFGNNVQVGGFVEQDVSGEDPDNVDYEADMPSFGGYFAYRENEDDTGVRAKSSAAVSSGKVELSRTNLLGPAELAHGKADLDGYALAQTVGYGVGISNNAVLTPFAGIAYISAKRGGYTEDGDAGGLGDVPEDDIFNYDDYAQRTTLGTLGLALDYYSYERFSLRSGVGFSYILNSDVDELNASSRVAGLESVGVQSGDNTGDMGLSGYIGIGFDITDNQRISLDYAAWYSIDTEEYAQYAMLGWSYSFGPVTQELGK